MCYEAITSSTLSSINIFCFIKHDKHIGRNPINNCNWLNGQLIASFPVSYTNIVYIHTLYFFVRHVRTDL